MESEAFEQALLSLVGQALEVADSSFDLRDMEPSLVAMVRLVLSQPEFDARADRLLSGLVAQLGETPDPPGLTDLLSYCVHTLALPGVIAEAKRLRREALVELEHGESRRPWEWARRCERVVEAASPTWEDRDMYVSLSV